MLEVKKPQPKFGISETEPKVKVIFVDQDGKTEDIIVWQNEGYEPVSKYAIHGDYESADQAAKAFAAFMKWYEEEKLTATSQEVEDRLDDEVVEHVRAEKFKWAQANNPNLTYEEFLKRHNRLVIEPYGDDIVRLRTTDDDRHPERVPEGHFMFEDFPEEE